MTKSEIQAEAIERARNGQSLANYPAIFEGFTAKGIAEADIKPRENVFTFNAWRALGRTVRRGEHGVKVVTFISCGGKVEVDAASGDETVSATYRKPHITTVFHVSQTDPWSPDAAPRPDYRTPRRSAWASGHGRYPSVDPGR